MKKPLPITDELIIPGPLLEWKAVRASGPGGQNVNKVASKVELRFDLECAEVLHEAVRARLRRLAAGRLDAEGKIIITCQQHRDQPRNLDHALEELRALILKSLVPPKRRRPTRPTRGSKERRIQNKKAVGKRKSERKNFDG